MSRAKRLTDAERMEIVRVAAEGVSTSELAARFGVTTRAVQYTLKADTERQQDAAVPVAAVSVNTCFFTFNFIIQRNFIFFDKSPRNTEESGR